MATTTIEWTERVWNALRGCTPISPGCANCYAMGQAHRFSGPGANYEGLTKLRKKGGPIWTGEVRFIVPKLDEPLHWQAPRRVFVNSMSDLFHEAVTDDQIAAMFGVMATCPQHTFQILTKRAERMAAWFASVGSDARERIIKAAVDLLDAKSADNVRSAAAASWPLPNVWLGVSVEDQQRANERIPHLLATAAAVRWLSVEPMLGPVDLSPWLSELNWVVLGGESGSSARPMQPTWAHVVRDQCTAAGVPFFFKQWGTWGPGDDCETLVRHIGKKTAGRTLDGQTWDEYPVGA